MAKTKVLASLVASLGLCVTACGGNVQAPDANPTPHDTIGGPGLLSGDSGNILTAFRKKGGTFNWGKGEGGGTAIGVNGYLWRAALETMNFLPLASADSNGGVIITDWAARPDKPEERVKATIYIFGKKLTTQAVQVKLFKQQNQNGQWVDVEASLATQRQLEDAILTKARTLKVQAHAQ
ncbi:MAG: DUF3576 domain-containing protein [Alphaproteobacteria bacterium]|nr:DUF3576 domain-containing protein [Alphaproteobacteria bacterium]MDD9919805.1 DUF3576 domain-containing protein [Alphaproteobacteria bacterium]